ncbi:MAG TPA: PAS domain-containing protein [Chthoniobacteraceae bacterium]|nr:PAS domain-containing protein [Chthoniobacteraceae bacterium]
MAPDSPNTPQPVRVLLVEDNPGDARLIAEMLADYRAQFEIHSQVTRLADAEAALEKADVHLVLLDLSLPDSQGFETFQRLLSHGRSFPILVLSGVDDESMALRMVHAGAQDYLVKGKFDGALLARAMRYAMERGSAERELELEKTLVRALMETMPENIYFKDRESRFLRINPSMMRLFNVARVEEVLGKTDFDFFLPEHASQAFADEQEIIRTGNPIEGKVEKETHPDGHITWVLTTKLPLRAPSGQIIGTMGMSRDITRMKEMEDQLAAERNLLRSVIENIPDPIFVKDTQGHYLLDNAAHCKTLGAEHRADVIGRTSFDFFPAGEAEGFKADDDIVIQTAQPIMNHEEAVPDAQGRKRWVLTTKAPLLNPETGRVERLVCIRRDITQMKEAEDKLIATNSELSSALSNLKQASEELRAIQLQLIEAEKMKSIGRLAAGVAHEVKNPLAIITMGVDYIEGLEACDDNTREILREMRAAVRRADNVIRGLLDFSAPRQLEVADESITEILMHALLLVRGEMSGQEFRLVTDLPPDLPVLRLDRMKVEQVFVNLLTNAIHAMPQGGTLSIRLYSKQLTGVGQNVAGSATEAFHVGDQVVVAEIDDSGTGIPESKLGKIFDPFYTTKPTGKGTGLGLTVTRSIIDLHGGTIEINNRPEGGARATVMFKV